MPPRDRVELAAVMVSRSYPSVPRLAVGVVVIRNGAVLLVRRAGAPGAGLWAVPGGVVELGETLAEAAEREVREETSITVRSRRAVHAFDAIERDDDGRISFHFVVVDLIADYVAGKAEAADDASAAAWFPLEDLPADEISRETLDLVSRLRDGLISGP